MTSEGASAPGSADYVTLSSNAALSNEQPVGTTVIMAGTEAGKPSASVNGRLYFATDSGITYRDTGAAWVQIAASDTAVVHISGIETITGAKTFSANPTITDAVNVVLGTTTGTKIGTSTTQKLGFYNVTPIAQRSGAAQTAVAATASSNVTPFGYTTAAQADAIVTLVNELRAWAVSQGFIKGSA